MAKPMPGPDPHPAAAPLRNFLPRAFQPPDLLHQRGLPDLERLVALLLVSALVLVAVAVTWYGRVAVPGHGESGTVVFNLTGVAADGVWTSERVHGLNYWWHAFPPAHLVVRQGEVVVLNLASADLYHQFYIPAFGVGPVDVEPGHPVSVRFRAEKAGVYQYYCTSLCGGCHFYMRGWLVVLAPGQEAPELPPILCRYCRDDELPPPTGESLVEQGAYLYLARGCVTCHGPEGRGGIANENSTSGTAPEHATTAQKLFLASEEDAKAFLTLLEHVPDLAALEELPSTLNGSSPRPFSGAIRHFPVVRTRFLNAREIIRGGRYSAPADPTGPVPPLQMPAWEYLLGGRDIDALLAYFVSLESWEEGEP